MSSSLNQLPILYSFRRCPYAIRARMALAHCKIAFELREVLLAKKPPALWLASAKGSVPVLVLQDGEVLDESLDIMRWAINRTYSQPLDRNNWGVGHIDSDVLMLLEKNDGNFKYALDGYKYGRPNSSKTQQMFRSDGEIFIAELDARLCQQNFLCGDNMSLVDVAIFPFIRQFAAVEPAWFEQRPYLALRQWLSDFLASELFLGVMDKHPIWTECHHSQ